MAIPISRTTYVNDGGGGAKPKQAPQYPMYGSNYGGVSQKSANGVYGSNYGGVTQNSNNANSNRYYTSQGTNTVVGKSKPNLDGLNKLSSGMTNVADKVYEKAKERASTVPPTGGTGGGYVGSATAEETPVASGGSGGGTSGQDDILEKIKSLLEEQKKQADSHYKTLYEQQLASNKSAWENNRNQINKNYVRTDRYLNNMYGDAVSGTGLSNRMRNYSNWNNNLTENQRNYTNNDASALASYNQGLSNNANTLAQGWYNYVLPVYTNRQQNTDDLDYRKYLMSLGLM